jgi:phospholipid N-methyltransferase
MNENLSFLKEYLKRGRDTGSVAPDSAALVDALLKHAPFGSARLILEYGPASGAVTKEIIKRRGVKTVLVCVEKNRFFYRELVKKISGNGIVLVHDDVFRWARESTGAGGMRGDADCIISTLPCSSIDFEAFLRVSVLPLLKKDAVFVQYMHTVSFLKGFRLRPLLEKHFAEVGSDFVLPNIPPTLVYTARGVL